MFDPYELQELGIERQRSLIAWRENRRESRRNLNQPLQEHAVITVPRRVFTTIINKLKSLSQARAAVAIRNRRGIR